VEPAAPLNARPAPSEFGDLRVGGLPHTFQFRDDVHLLLKAGLVGGNGIPDRCGRD
jgi:hypothetical protein